MHVQNAFLPPNLPWHSLSLSTNWPTQASFPSSGDLWSALGPMNSATQRHHTMREKDFFLCLGWFCSQCPQKLINVAQSITKSSFFRDQQYSPFWVEPICSDGMTDSSVPTFILWTMPDILRPLSGLLDLQPSVDSLHVVETQLCLLRSHCDALLL